MAGLSIDNVSKMYGATPVLRDINLEVRDGEFLTLVGSSGCGKSTMLRVIAGLEAQDTGRIAIGDRSVDDLRPKERNVAMVFQSYALYPHMTVAENIAMPLVMQRFRLAERLPLIGRLSPRRTSVLATIAAEVDAVARQLHIEHLLDRRPSQLSGGQRQRVALGRAMVRRPDVFLMDEPLSNLDAKLRVHMRSELIDLHKRIGVTFIYVTHDQVEAMTMSDRVALMDEGRIVQLGTPTQLYHDPADLRVARFIGSPGINVLPGEVVSEGLLVGSALLPVACSAAPRTVVAVGLRPESLTIEAATDRPHLRGRLTSLENLGAEVFMHIQLSGEESAVVVRASLDVFERVRAHGGLEGEIAVGVDPRRVLVFSSEGQRLGGGTAVPAAMPKPQLLPQAVAE